MFENNLFLIDMKMFNKFELNLIFLQYPLNCLIKIQFQGYPIKLLFL